MAICKFCQKPFAWGINDGKFVPLVPIGEEGDQPRTYQDENGVLRVEHRAICVSAGGPTVRIARLARSVEAKDILPAAKPAEPVVARSGRPSIASVRGRRKRIECLAHPTTAYGHD